jgi:phosphoserine aminotransferase
MNKFNMRKLYFTPGPSELYFTAEHHLKMAFKNGVPSISHRSSQFQSIFKEAVDNLRELLKLPDSYQIVFTTSATEVWERITENLIDQHSLHIVNGAFSKKFYTAATTLGKQTTLLETPWGDLPDVASIEKDNYDVIAVTHNETSTGVRFPLGDIKSIRNQYPEALIVVDGVSSLPVVDFDYDDIDSVYVSVQKCFGLPAGLGIWLVNDRCIERASMLSSGHKTWNTYHSLLALTEQAKNYQTPSTPNVLNIYLLSKVVEDMLNRGVKMIRNDTTYKAAIMYNMLDKHDKLKPFVQNSRLRSNTIIVVESDEHTQEIIDYLDTKQMIVGAGYGQKKASQIRIANFPTHSKEQFEMLTDLIERW